MNLSTSASASASAPSCRSPAGAAAGAAGAAGAMQLASRMKDDPKTNMAFVAAVKQHPVLYDYTLPGHSSRELQDEAWHQVALESGDSVGNCKERWKNLRASLCRHLRQQQQASQGQGNGQRPKKPYYLADHMEFVVPFTKIRPPGFHYHSPAGSVSSSLLDAGFDPLDFMDEVKQEVDDDHRPDHSSADADGDGSADDEVAESSWVDHGDGPAVLQVLDGSISAAQLGGRKRKREPREPRDPLEVYTDEADLNFLKSLLPDMAVMTARQKNSFKMAVLSSIEKIVYSPASDSEQGEAGRRGQQQQQDGAGQAPST